MGDHADDRGVERLAAHRPVELRVAEGEDAAVARDEPVAAAVLGRGEMPTTGALRRLVAHRPVEHGVAEGEDAAVCAASQ